MMFGQNMYDALRYSQQYYDGTARSLSMGNALASLGGDLGALSYNPAASGVYRYTELAVTPMLYTNLSRTEYTGNKDNQNMTRFVLSNAGWVGGFKTGNKKGFMGMNFAIAVNQTNNFNFRTSASGTEAYSSFLASLAANMPAGTTGYGLDMPDNNSDAPFYNGNASWTSVLAWNTGLLDTLDTPDFFIGATENITPDGIFMIPGNLKQKFYNERKGYIQDVVFNASGNISDILFFGASVTLQSIYFSEYSSFSETAEEPRLFQTGFSRFTSEYRENTTGLGLNFKAGFIVRPIAGLSIGGSISTPDLMYLKGEWRESMSGETVQFGASSLDSPIGISDYRITAPFKLNLGAGYTLGNLMAVGIDYERTDYSSIKMSDTHGNEDIFDDDNHAIASDFKAVNNIRAGIEYRITPKLAIRLGYNYYDAADKYSDKRHYASAGFGYVSKNGFFMDLAYQHQCNYNSESYTLYDDYYSNINPNIPVDAPVLKEKYKNWKLLFTFGLRF